MDADYVGDFEPLRRSEVSSVTWFPTALSFVALLVSLGSFWISLLGYKATKTRDAAAAKPVLTLKTTVSIEETSEISLAVENIGSGIATVESLSFGYALVGIEPVWSSKWETARRAAEIFIQNRYQRTSENLKVEVRGTMLEAGSSIGKSEKIVFLFIQISGLRTRDRDITIKEICSNFQFRIQYKDALGKTHNDHFLARVD